MITFHEGLLAVMMLHYTHGVLSKGLFGESHSFIGAFIGAYFFLNCLLFDSHNIFIFFKSFSNSPEMATVKETHLYV